MKNSFISCITIIALFVFAGCSSGVDGSPVPIVPSSTVADENNPVDSEQSPVTSTPSSVADGKSSAETSMPSYGADDSSTTVTSPLSSATNESGTASPSPPSSTPAAKSPVKPTPKAPPIRPTSPFPDFRPNYLRILYNELSKDYDDGNFLVGDGIAINYQVWYEFIGKVNKKKDTELTIQTFEIDPSKINFDPTRFKLISRYHLSVQGEQAVWKHLSDGKTDISGRLSYIYNAETGLNEVFIEEEKVFEFIYFPADPKKAALYFGYTPLEELPAAYAAKDAIRDGCWVIEHGVIQNIKTLKKYIDSSGNRDMGTFVRIFLEDDEGIKVMDIGFHSYNERGYAVVDYSRCSNRDDMEDIYITTYYDNAGVGLWIDENNISSLDIGFDYLRETLFIFENLPAKEN